MSFSGYALEDRANAAGSTTALLVPTPAATTAAGAGATPAGTSLGTAARSATGTAGAAAAPSGTQATATTATAAPTATATATSTSGSGYADGTYTGSSVNVRWGYVQVQATIQGGQIAQVQFLQYPNERTTSVRINSVAVPALQQEAVQAQSANVNIVTGATLTSQGFEQSLQSALAQAQA